MNTKNVVIALLVLALLIGVWYGWKKGLFRRSNGLGTPAPSQVPGAAVTTLSTRGMVASPVNEVFSANLQYIY